VRVPEHLAHAVLALAPPREVADAAVARVADAALARMAGHDRPRDFHDEAVVEAVARHRGWDLAEGPTVTFLRRRVVERIYAASRPPTE
jgi:hypothetical protein